MPNRKIEANWLQIYANFGQLSASPIVWELSSEIKMFIDLFGECLERQQKRDGKNMWKMSLPSFADTPHSGRAQGRRQCWGSATR